MRFRSVTTVNIIITKIYFIIEMKSKLNDDLKELIEFLGNENREVVIKSKAIEFLQILSEWEKGDEKKLNI